MHLRNLVNQQLSKNCSETEYELISTDDFEKDLDELAEVEKNLVIKVKTLIEDILKHPFTGIGKPEPLKHGFSGCWSRRVNKGNRLVYRVHKRTIKLISCIGHYE